jgi:hypothetical protein
MSGPTGNKQGRPSNAALKALKPKGRGVIGRPKGDAAIINDYKARMLNSPKSAAVLEKILQAALDDAHPHQGAAWKLVIDRIAPLSLFDPNKNSGGNMPQISINITGLTQPTIETVQEVYDISNEEDK